MTRASGLPCHSLPTACLHGTLLLPRAGLSSGAGLARAAGFAPASLLTSDAVLAGSAVLVSVLSGLLASGCSPARPPACGAPGTRLVSQVVMVSAWAHEPVTATDLVPGLDLDGHVDDGTRPGCDGELDYGSSLTGARGIDNQWSGLVLPLLEGGRSIAVGPAVATQLRRGEFLLALEITAPSRSSAPPSISILTVEPTDGIGVDPSTGALLPGQFVTVTSRTEAGAVCTSDGMLEVSVPSLELPFGTSLGSATVEDVRFRLVVGEDGRIETGELGAAFPVAAFIEMFTPILPVDEATIRAVARPDLSPDRTGELCGAISIGLGVDFVTARLVP